MSTTDTQTVVLSLASCKLRPEGHWVFSIARTESFKQWLETLHPDEAKSANFVAYALMTAMACERLIRRTSSASLRSDCEHMLMFELGDLILHELAAELDVDVEVNSYPGDSSELTFEWARHWSPELQEFAKNYIKDYSQLQDRWDELYNIADSYSFWLEPS